MYAFGTMKIILHGPYLTNFSKVHAQWFSEVKMGQKHSEFVFISD